MCASVTKPVRLDQRLSQVKMDQIWYLVCLCWMYSKTLELRILMLHRDGTHNASIFNPGLQFKPVALEAGPLSHPETHPILCHSFP